MEEGTDDALDPALLIQPGTNVIPSWPGINKQNLKLSQVLVGLGGAPSSEQESCANLTLKDLENVPVSQPVIVALYLDGRQVSKKSGETEACISTVIKTRPFRSLCARSLRTFSVWAGENFVSLTLIIPYILLDFIIEHGKYLELSVSFYL